MQKKHTLYRAVVSCTLLLSGYAVQAAENEDKVVVLVNDAKITQQQYDDYQKARGHQGGAVTADRQTVVEELIARELLFQEANKQKLDATPEVVRDLETLRYNYLAEAMMQAYLKKNPATDEQLKAHYDKLIAKATMPTEYKARHVLLEKEEDAKAVIAELKAGKAFAELATAKSKDEGSAKKGGDLGWFTAQQMVPAFSEAVAKMEKNKFTETPVKSDFGWHVILLEDSRTVAPPTFEAVKERVKGNYQNEQMRAYMEELKKPAKIEIKEPLAVDADPAKATLTK